MGIPETFSSCHSTPIIILFCKCIDGTTKFAEKMSESRKDFEIRKTTSIKVAV